MSSAAPAPPGFICSPVFLAEAPGLNLILRGSGFPTKVRNAAAALSMNISPPPIPGRVAAGAGGPGLWRWGGLEGG